MANQEAPKWLESLMEKISKQQIDAMSSVITTHLSNLQNSNEPEVPPSKRRKSNGGEPLPPP